jgi:hypothetical protein
MMCLAGLVGLNMTVRQATKRVSCLGWTSGRKALFDRPGLYSRCVWCVPGACCALLHQCCSPLVCWPAQHDHRDVDSI